MTQARALWLLSIGLVGAAAMFGFREWAYPIPSAQSPDAGSAEVNAAVNAAKAHPAVAALEDPSGATERLPVPADMVREDSEEVRRGVVQSIERMMRETGSPNSAHAEQMLDQLAEEALIKSDPDALIEAPLFRAAVPETVRSSHAYRSRFRQALMDLRAARRDLIARRDTLTGDYITLVERGVVPRGSSERKPGQLGGNVGSTVPGMSGWIGLPPDHEAYRVQADIVGWKLYVVDLLLQAARQ